MKFTVDKDIFSEAVGWVVRALPEKVPNEILSCIKLEATEDGFLCMSVFDYYISARNKIAVNVSEAGEVLVPAALLNKISRALPNKPITFELKESKAVVRAGNSKYTLPTTSASDYPELPELQPKYAMVDSASLGEAISQVSFAIANDPSQPILTGIYCEINKDVISLFATDMYRVAARDLQWTLSKGDEEITTSDKKIKFLLPGKSFGEIGKMLRDSSNVAIGLKFDEAKTTQDSMTASMVTFETKNRQITVQTMGGEYFNLNDERAFPRNFANSILVRVDEFLEAAKRVSLVSDALRDDKKIFLHVLPNGSLSLTTDENSDSQGNEIIENIKSTIDEFSIIFDSKYLIDGLNAIEEPYVKLCFNGADQTAEIIGQQEKDGEPSHYYRYNLATLHK